MRYKIPLALGCGVVCALIAYCFQLPFSVYVCLLVVFVYALCIWDIVEFAVLDWQNGAFFALSISKILFIQMLGIYPSEVILAILYDVLLGAGAFALCYVFGKMICKKEILGEADIVFGASMSGLFGFHNVILSVFWGCVVASIIIICGRILSKNFVKIPLIPFMVVGFWLGVLV